MKECDEIYVTICCNKNFFVIIPAKMRTISNEEEEKRL